MSKDYHGPRIMEWMGMFINLLLKGAFIALYGLVYIPIEKYIINPLPPEAWLVRYTIYGLEVLFTIATFRSAYRLVFK